jgi:hypothetical protein
MRKRNRVGNCIEASPVASLSVRPELHARLISDTNEIVAEVADDFGSLGCLQGRLVHGDKDCLF